MRASALIGQLTAGQDIKIIKDLGLAAISIFGLLIAVFLGITLVWKEIEQRSIYSMLAKPLSRAEFDHVAGINRRFRERFGFPCIVALALHPTRASVIAEMERALEGTREAALARAFADGPTTTAKPMSHLKSSGKKARAMISAPHVLSDSTCLTAVIQP